MKITIDTKVDTKDEIRKAISFLSSLSGGSVYTNSGIAAEEKPARQNDIFSDNSSPAVGGGIFSMFGDASPAQAAAPAQAAQDEVKKERKPQIQIIEY